MKLKGYFRGVTAAGPLPISTGFPIKPLRAPSVRSVRQTNHSCQELIRWKRPPPARARMACASIRMIMSGQGSKKKPMKMSFHGRGIIRGRRPIFFSSNRLSMVKTLSRTWHAGFKSRRRILLYFSITGQAMVTARRYHGQHGAAPAVDCRIAEHEGRPSFRFRFVRKGPSGMIYLNSFVLTVGIVEWQ